MFGVEDADTEESVGAVISVEAKACAAEGFGEFVHLAADGLVNDAGVDLRRGEFRMAEHLANRFD